MPRHIAEVRAHVLSTPQNICFGCNPWVRHTIELTTFTAYIQSSACTDSRHIPASQQVLPLKLSSQEKSESTMTIRVEFPNATSNCTAPMYSLSYRHINSTEADRRLVDLNNAMRIQFIVDIPIWSTILVNGSIWCEQKAEYASGVINTGGGSGYWLYFRYLLTSYKYYVNVIQWTEYNFILFIIHWLTQTRTWFNVFGCHRCNWKMFRYKSFRKEFHVFRSTTVSRRVLSIRRTANTKPSTLRSA